MIKYMTWIVSNINIKDCVEKRMLGHLPMNIEEVVETCSKRKGFFYTEWFGYIFVLKL